MLRIAALICGFCILAVGAILVLARQNEAKSPWVAYASNVEGALSLYRLRADTSTDYLADQERVTTPLVGFDDKPAWSPDGKWIVFLGTRQSRRHMYLVRANGTSAPQAILPDENISSYNTPIWSPDGEWIAFTGLVDGNADIYRVRPDGSDIQQLTENPSGDWLSDWSPDGQWLVFETTRDGNSEIYRMRSNGEDIQRLTDLVAYDGEAHFSPSSDQLVFVSRRDGTREIYRMNIDGSQQIRMTSHADEERLPIWTPDGNSILFQIDTAGWQADIYQIQVDGSERRPFIQSTPWLERSPAWAPVIDMQWRAGFPLIAGLALLLAAFWRPSTSK